MSFQTLTVNYPSPERRQKCALAKLYCSVCPKTQLWGGGGKNSLQSFPAYRKLPPHGLAFFYVTVNLDTCLIFPLAPL